MFGELGCWSVLFRERKHTKACTPYSMNSLFSELFRKFSGVILGVCDTIWRLFGGHLGGVL